MSAESRVTYWFCWFKRKLLDETTAKIYIFFLLKSFFTLCSFNALFHSFEKVLSNFSFICFLSDFPLSFPFCFFWFSFVLVGFLLALLNGSCINSDDMSPHFTSSISQSLIKQQKILVKLLISTEYPRNAVEMILLSLQLNKGNPGTLVLRKYMTSHAKLEPWTKLCIN